MAVIIRLQNLPLSANASSIRSFFQGLKIPDGGVNIVGGDDGDAFIAFGTDDDARQAMLLSGQKINGVPIRLFLSSKQEMQKIITDAQSGVLKRTATLPPVDHVNVNDKRSYSYYNPECTSSYESFDNPPNSKMRIIDYSVMPNNGFNGPNIMNNKENNLYNEPPRPSEFSYKIARPIIQANPMPMKEETPSYRYDTPDYNEYRINYNSQQPRFEESMPPFRNNLRHERRSSPEHFQPSEEYYNEQIISKTLLPTPPVHHERHQLHMPRREQQIPQTQHHDYTERPRWLEECKDSFGPICTSCVVRLVLPPSIINPKTIFDLFRNITIVPKRGIKMEQDNDKRLTGYVFVLLVSTYEAAKALRLSNKVFRGIIINVESMPDEDFDRTCDRSEQPDLSDEKLIRERSPYYRDLCLEISNIPQDISESDLKDYLNISINNRNLHFMQFDDCGYCLITASDETMMLDILKFNGVNYRGSTIKVVAISKPQLQSFLATRTRDSRRIGPKPFATARKYAEESRTALTCAKIENLPEIIKAVDLKQIFLPSLIPLPYIIVKGNAAVVDLMSVNTCQKVISDIKSRSGIDFSMTAITNADFQTLKADYLSVSGGQKSAVSNVDKRNTDSNKSRSTTPSSEVRIKNFPNTITNTQIKDLIHNFEYQPRTIKICYEKGRNLGEAILTFKNSTEAVEFKDEFHGMWFMQRELDVLLSEN